MTLRELLKDKTLPVKAKDIDRAGLFEIVSFNSIAVVGFWNNGTPECFNLDNDSFRLYTKPPKLVKKTMYQSVYKTPNTVNICQGYLYNSKEDALEECGAIGVVEVIVEVKSETNL
jgi:hypothetical protein